jgi:hypothetical protein
MTPVILPTGHRDAQQRDGFRNPPWGPRDADV